MISEYRKFLDSKQRRARACGFTPHELPDKLFDWQQRITEWACKGGRTAIFSDCGTGKTAMQLAWADAVRRHTKGYVLIVAPLAVGHQTEREGEKFGVQARYMKSAYDLRESDRIIITNYERIASFDSSMFSGIVLDESSILKSIDGKTRKALTEFSADIPYRLCCTATPSPNDYMELGNHAEYLGVMKASEMLATFFVHDGGETSKWRLKGHAEKEFWRWVCSWAVAIKKPSDIGGSDEGFNLHALIMNQCEVDVDEDGIHLFPMEASTLAERRAARKNSLASRVARAAKIVAEDPDEPWLIWCNLNAESEALKKSIPNSIEVRGSDPSDFKEEALRGFAEGMEHVLISKPSICGHGMNFQRCARVLFVGLSDSYEQFYQAVRRCWRFGQTREVKCYIVTATTEGAVVRNIERKERDAIRMMEGMVRAMKEEHELTTQKQSTQDLGDRASGESWNMINGDCVEEVRKLDSDSVGFSVFSPPFSSLYTYTDSERDMGNSTDDQFWDHMGFLIPELFRVTQPGRLVSFHCMDLPSSKQFHGVIGLRDFRGELIRAFQSCGWIYHSNVTIWKDPVTAMQRTKALGLLWKQIKKDSSMSRQGVPDYVVTMRKPGENKNPIDHSAKEFPVEQWQRWASPIWMDINPSDTLQYRSARADEDERHICPLQLEVIRRCLCLWSRPGDLVLSPFAGIGSEGHEALLLDRRFLGVELKRSYYEQACRNLAHAEQFGKAQQTLFAG